MIGILEYMLKFYFQLNRKVCVKTISNLYRNWFITLMESYLHIWNVLIVSTNHFCAITFYICCFIINQSERFIQYLRIEHNKHLV